MDVSKDTTVQLQVRCNTITALSGGAAGTTMSASMPSVADVITIGSTFRLQKDGDNKSFLYTLVGSEESDMSMGKISNLSPLGQSLVGHKKGDTVTVSAPKGKINYKIEDIIK